MAAPLPADVVLDTSAILALLQGEPGADRVLELLGQARRRRLRLHTGFLCLMEVEYGVMRRLGDSFAERTMATVLSWPISVRESTPDWRHSAAAVKARGGLSLADSWIAALAISLDADLVHKDREFDAVPGLRSAHL